MENEVTQNNESQQENVSSDNSNYIEAIREMKEKSVPRTEYEKLQKENKQLLDSLVNGETRQEPIKEEINIDDIRKDLFTKEMTNMEYIDKALKLRDALIEKEHIDIFVGSGKNFKPTEDDFKKAQEVADVFKECLDIADGDSEVFVRELDRRTIDVAPQFSRINNNIRR